MYPKLDMQMSSDDYSWKSDIRNKLSTLFAQDGIGLARILWYLDEEENAYRNSNEIAPVWRTLQSVLHSDAFKVYAERMIEDTKRAERDPKFRETMNLMYSQMMSPSDQPLPKNSHQGFDIVRLADVAVNSSSASIGFAQALASLPLSAQESILSELSQFLATNESLVAYTSKAVSTFNKVGGSVIVVALAAVYLGFEAIHNIRRWWRGEISGRRCAKNIVDNAVTIAGGIAGGLTGASIGSLAGPVGTLAGGIIGGIISSQALNFLIDRLTQTLFGIPKDEALENAYRYFGVKKNASNSEINSAFRKLCLQHHPDKGGEKEEFFIVQSNMAVIKMARGSL